MGNDDHKMPIIYLISCCINLHRFSPITCLELHAVPVFRFRSPYFEHTSTALLSRCNELHGVCGRQTRPLLYCGHSPPAHHPPPTLAAPPHIPSLMITCRAGKSTQLVYLSKSTSNSEKSYSSTSKSTQKKLYLKYK